MRKFLLLSGVLAMIPVAEAQLGPASARVLSRQMPSKAPAAQTFSAEAELVIRSDGKVDTVTIINGSGDDDFDKQWRKAMSDWRFVPAVDDGGQPAQSTTQVIYKNTGLSIGAPTGNAVTESARIERMTCKDYVWEYRFVTDAQSRRFALLDPLLKTPKVMLTAAASLDDAQLATLNDRYDDVLSDATKQCRDDPDALFWKSVLEPALKAALVN